MPVEESPLSDSVASFIEAKLKPLRELRTGDLLLYRTNDVGAQFNAVVQGSYYSHVSMVVDGDPDVLEELYHKDYKPDREGGTKEGVAIFEVEPNRGVALFPIEARLARSVKNIRHISVRRHVGEITEENRTKFFKFMKEVMGRPLEIATFDMFRALLFSRCMCARNHGRDLDENWDQFFCSELVAEGLQQLGIFREGKVKSNTFIPASFEDPHRDAEKMGHDGAFDVLDQEKVCLPGHSYEKSELLIETKNEMWQALRGKKKQMKEARKAARRKSHGSILQRMSTKRKK